MLELLQHPLREGGLVALTLAIWPLQILSGGAANVHLFMLWGRPRYRSRPADQKFARHGYLSRVVRITGRQLRRRSKQAALGGRETIHRSRHSGAVWRGAASSDALDSCGTTLPIAVEQSVLHWRGSLLQERTCADHSFCSILAPTLPRLIHMRTLPAGSLAAIVRNG